MLVVSWYTLTPCCLCVHYQFHSLLAIAWSLIYKGLVHFLQDNEANLRNNNPCPGNVLPPSCTSPVSVPNYRSDRHAVVLRRPPCLWGLSQATTDCCSIFTFPKHRQQVRSTGNSLDIQSTKYTQTNKCFIQYVNLIHEGFLTPKILQILQNKRPFIS